MRINRFGNNNFRVKEEVGNAIKIHKGIYAGESLAKVIYIAFFQICIVACLVLCVVSIEKENIVAAISSFAAVIIFFFANFFIKQFHLKSVEKKLEADPNKIEAEATVKACKLVSDIRTQTKSNVSGQSVYRLILDINGERSIAYTGLSVFQQDEFITVLYNPERPKYCVIPDSEATRIFLKNRKKR